MQLKNMFRIIIKYNYDAESEAIVILTILFLLDTPVIK